jgi:hypothetical protein
MLDYNTIEIGDIIYMIESEKALIEAIVLGKIVKNNEPRLKLKSTDLTFEVIFKDIKTNGYNNKNEAEANFTKQLCLVVNKLIRISTNDELQDYYDLELKIKKYKELFPELYI